MLRFERLDIWQASVAYADKCYEAAKTFPKEETFSLSDQLRRAAVSIPNNIAEGCAGSDREFRSYLGIAVRSAFETASILVFAEKRGYIGPARRQGLYSEVEHLIIMMRALRKLLS